MNDYSAAYDPALGQLLDMSSYWPRKCEILLSDRKCIPFPPGRFQQIRRDHHKLNTTAREKALEINKYFYSESKV